MGGVLEEGSSSDCGESGDGRETLVESGKKRFNGANQVGDGDGRKRGTAPASTEGSSVKKGGDVGKGGNEGQRREPKAAMADGKGQLELRVRREVDAGGGGEQL